MDETITSTRNPRVKAIAALSRKKVRDAEGRYLVEGPNAVGEALADGVVDEVLVADDLDPGPYRGQGVQVTVVSPSRPRAHRRRDDPPGRGRGRPHRDRRAGLGGRPGRAGRCEQVADPGNAGNIVRTADAAGAAGVVLTTGSVDVFNPKAVRAAAGSLTHLPIVVDVTVAEVLAACRAAGQETVALDAGGSDDVFDLEHRTRPVALVFGNEAHGVSPATLAAVDRTVAIPRLGRAESLNLATAVAVTVYAAARADRRPRGGRSGDGQER